MTFALESGWKNEQLDILHENSELKLQIPLVLYYNLNTIPGLFIFYVLFNCYFYCMIEL